MATIAVLRRWDAERTTNLVLALVLLSLAAFWVCVGVLVRNAWAAAVARDPSHVLGATLWSHRSLPTSLFMLLQSHFHCPPSGVVGVLREFRFSCIPMKILVETRGEGARWQGETFTLDV